MLNVAHTIMYIRHTCLLDYCFEPNLLGDESIYLLKRKTLNQKNVVLKLKLMIL